MEELKASPIAVNTDDANEQHYEVPARFYEVVLGKYSKYSSEYSLWKEGRFPLEPQMGAPLGSANRIPEPYSANGLPRIC